MMGLCSSVMLSLSCMSVVISSASASSVCVVLLLVVFSGLGGYYACLSSDPHLFMKFASLCVDLLVGLTSSFVLVFECIVFVFVV